MPCALSQAIRTDCRNNVGGIKQIYVTEIANVSFFSGSLGGTITSMSMSGSTKWYQYSFRKQTGTFAEDMAINDANGTVYYQPKVTLQFSKLENNKRNEISLLSQNEVAAIVLTGNGDLIATGQYNGLTITQGSAATGQSFGDLNGYTLTLSGNEPAPMQFLSSSAVLASSIVQS